MEIKGLPANIVVRVGEISIPHFYMQHGAVMVVHVEGEALIESWVEGF